MVYVAVLGHGVVGSGVVEVINNNQAGIAKKAGQNIEVKRILDLRDFDVDYKDKFTKDFNDILNDDEISIVVEVMGGLHPAYEFTKAALEAKKSVVTSNKELVAAKGAELLKTASENDVNYYFEASVGGGIPIITPLHQCLAANEIDEIAGILNGTTNFILTKMIRDKMEFSDALKMAQELGYAERNPSADVEGHDACRKICILASLAFGRQIHPDNVYTKGITDVTLTDTEYAKACGGVIKLIANAKKLDNGKIECMVSPSIVMKESQLANIDDVFNGVLVRGNATGDVVFYGKGAGKLPTASAVVADVIDESKAAHTTNSLYWEPCDENLVCGTEDMYFKYYILCNTEKPLEFCAFAENFFGEVQPLSRPDKPKNEAAVVTPLVSHSKLNEFVEKAKSQNHNVVTNIRIVNY